MKTLVCETSIDSVEDVVVRISVGAERMRDTAGIFQNVWNSMRRRCESCVTASGSNFGSLLRHLAFNQ
ncbi:hypothetical protein AVEN_103651-1, partial [Araneus ventricosus]